MRMHISSIAFGCLVKPLAAAFGARFVCAGPAVRDEFEPLFSRMSHARPQSRSLMEGPVDGNATFNASRYRSC